MQLPLRGAGTQAAVTKNRQFLQRHTQAWQPESLFSPVYPRVWGQGAAKAGPQPFFMLSFMHAFMTKYHALSKIDHAGQSFQRYTSYGFAAAQNIAPLVQQELAKACMSLAIGFMRQGEHFMPVAVQGFLPGKNLLVAPDGRWLGQYIPAAYRGYPFALLPNEAGQLVLCIDTDSGLLADADAEGQGEALFDAQGEPTQAIQQVMHFLEQTARNRQATLDICKALAQQQLLQPWPMEVQTAQGKKEITGLFRIDEAALNQLDAQALKALQQGGGLQMAYMQLLSMQHLDKLAELAKAHEQHEQAQAQTAAALPVNSKGELDLEFLNQTDTLSFSGL